MDGTNVLITAGSCNNPASNPFWKKNIDVQNKVGTKWQLERKKIFDEKYAKRYFNHVSKRMYPNKNLDLLSSTVWLKFRRRF